MRTNIIALLVATILTFTEVCESAVELTEAGTTNDFRIVCYYGSWAASRTGVGQFLPENINPFLCTHLLYAFASIGHDIALKPYNETFDIELGGYERFNALKQYNPKLKTALCLGGWNEGSVKFSSIAADPTKRSIFVKNVIKYLRQHNFNGFEIDWQFPNLKDRHGYSSLIRELREGFEIEAIETGRPRLRLAITLPTLTDHVNRGYDIVLLAKYVDCMHALTYNYHTEFEPLVNHHSKLYSVDGNADYEVNANYTIEFYLASGAVRRKLDLGIPTYGKSYNLSDPNLTDIGSPASGPGLKGDLTKEAGVLAYFEICKKIKDEGWITKQPNPEAMGQYAYKGNQWVGYDDENIMRKKGEYVAKHGLGGMMFWLMEYDDFHGYCDGKPFPLIEAAKEGLLSTPRYIPEKVIEGNEATIFTKNKEAIFDNSQLRNFNADRYNNPEKVNEEDNKVIPIDELRVICYYGSWAASKRGMERFTPENIDPFLCTHILYAFGRLTRKFKFEPANEVIDIKEGGYEKFTGLKKINKNLKAMLSLRIQNADSMRFSTLVANSTNRNIFVQNSIKYLRQHNFDGLEFHWKYPNLNDRRRYSSLIKELREGYERESIETGLPRLLLAITLPTSTDHVNRGYDIPLLTKYVDCMHPLTYNYHDEFEPMVNHHSQLYNVDNTKYSDFETNTNYTMSFYVESGAERPRLAIGVPTFGRAYTLSDLNTTDIGSPAAGPGFKTEQTSEDRAMAYSEICRKIKEDGWKVRHPYPNAMGPYAYKDNQWVGYDDEDIMRKKGEYVARSKFGGIVFWLMEYDDFHGRCGGKPFPLIEAAKEGLIRTARSINAEIARSNSDKGKPVKNSVQLEKEETANTPKTPWTIQETIPKPSPLIPAGGISSVSNKINPVFGSSNTQRSVLSRSVSNLRPTQFNENELSKNPEEVNKKDKEEIPIDELRVICYYGSWAAKKTGMGRFTPDNIDPFLCTHILYAFGRISVENCVFEPANKLIDIEQGGYAKFTGLKKINKNLRPMLSLRIQNSESAKFSSAAASSEKRSVFVQNSIKFLRQHSFDGLEFHWKYPNLRDRRSYSSLIKELREGYEQESIETGLPRLLLAITLPTSTDHVNRGYDIPLLSKYVDCMHPLTYNYHDVFEPMVNHHSQLYSVGNAKYSDFEMNTNYTMSFYVESGAARPRLAIGVPTFGRAYTLSDLNTTDIGSPAAGPGLKGNQTNEKGAIAYSEICRKIKEDGWKVRNPYPNAMGPYAYKDNQWVGYDDEDIMWKKGEYVAKSKFGGIVFWLMEYDDFHGYCGGKPFPLIEAAKDGLIRTARSINAESAKSNRNEEKPLQLSVNQLIPTKAPWEIQEQDIFGSIPNIRPTQFNEEKYPDKITLSGTENYFKDDQNLKELQNFFEQLGGVERLKKILNMQNTTPATGFKPLPTYKTNSQRHTSNKHTVQPPKEESTSNIRDSVSSLFDAEGFKKSKILNIVFNIDFQ